MKRRVMTRFLYCWDCMRCVASCFLILQCCKAFLRRIKQEVGGRLCSAVAHTHTLGGCEGDAGRPN